VSGVVLSMLEGVNKSEVFKKLHTKYSKDEKTFQMWKSKLNVVGLLQRMIRFDHTFSSRIFQFIKRSYNSDCSLTLGREILEIRYVAFATTTVVS